MTIRIEKPTDTSGNVTLPIAESDVTGLVSDLAGKASSSSVATNTTDIATNATAIAGKAQGLTPTAVKTSAYTAAAGEFVPVDTTSGAVTITLPTAPADKTRIGIKHVTQGGTNAVTYACGGSDVINKTAGVTSGTLTLLSQAVSLQYQASGAIWYVTTADVPLSQTDLRYTTTRTLSVTGTLSTRTGTARVYVEEGYTITSVRASVGTAPTGATVIVDVNKNGTTIYTTQGNRPAIAISGNTATSNSPDVATLAAGDYLTVDIDAVGSTIPGAELTVSIGMHR